MKNKLELVRLVFQKMQSITSKMGNVHKKACCIFKTMFTIHENTLNFVYNPLKYKKLYSIN